MRVLIRGGPPEMVLEGEKRINGVACSSSPAIGCIFGEESPDRRECILTRFNPKNGRGNELARVALEKPVDKYFWSLTPEGTSLAFAQDLRGREKRIQILSLSNDEKREVVIKSEIQLRSLDWTIDGSGFFVGSCSPEAGLFFVGMDGRSELLWKTEWAREAGPRGLPSPDGRHLALRNWSKEANISMLEGF